MAVLKQRLHRKNAGGTYDTVHLETSADLVLMSDGTTKLSDKLSSMDAAIVGKAAASHGTHVTFTTSAPKAAGTASVGTASTVSRSDHVHPAQTSVTGNAGTATKLATSRTIRTNLASTGTASFDGSANVTPGVTGVLPVANGGTGVTSLDDLKAALGVGTAGTSGVINNANYSDIISGTIGLGTVVTMASRQWIVVHFDTVGHVFYLLTVDIESTTKFGSNTVYSGSTLASVAQTFENNLPANVRNRLATLNVNGVTAKVIVPSLEQYNGGFTYLKSNANHIAKYNGTATAYWTSSSYGSSGAWLVTTDGIISNFDPSDAFGFRPCVALAM